MTLAALRDYLIASPVSFAIGLLIGFYLGARFDLRRKSDV